METQQTNEWVSVHEAATRTGYSERWIQRLAQTNQIPWKLFAKKAIMVDMLTLQTYKDERDKALLAAEPGGEYRIPDDDKDSDDAENKD
jgi:hypothetical protein